MNKYKNPYGQHLLRELFIEYDSPYALYTLQEKDVGDVPSLYRLYMEANDPTEWTFAQEHLDGWEHWSKLVETVFFRDHAKKFRNHLELKLRSQALSKIINTANGTTKDAYAANRYINEKGWQETPKATKGRPSKEQISEAAHELAQNEKREKDDLERLMN